jgi:hypothetical protein
VGAAIGGDLRPFLAKEPSMKYISRAAKSVIRIAFTGLFISYAVTLWYMRDDDHYVILALINERSNLLTDTRADPNYRDLFIKNPSLADLRSKQIGCCEAKTVFSYLNGWPTFLPRKKVSITTPFKEAHYLYDITGRVVDYTGYSPSPDERRRIHSTN